MRACVCVPACGVWIDGLDRLTDWITRVDMPAHICAPYKCVCMQEEQRLINERFAGLELQLSQLQLELQVRYCLSLAVC